MINYIKSQNWLNGFIFEFLTACRHVFSFPSLIRSIDFCLSIVLFFPFVAEGDASSSTAVKKKKTPQKTELNGISEMMAVRSKQPKNLWQQENQIKISFFDSLLAMDDETENNYINMHSMAISHVENEIAFVPLFMAQSTSAPYCVVFIKNCMAKYKFLEFQNSECGT